MSNVPDRPTLHWRGEPTRGDAAEVLERLGPVTAQYELTAGVRRVRTATYVDTVDWRLRRRGLVLAHERATGPGTLVLTGAGEPVTTPLTEPPQWPVRVEHLEPGPVRDQVAAAMWIRAVSPIARSRTVSREVAVLNSDGKTVVRLDWIEVTGREPIRTPPMVQVAVRPVLGYQRAADRVLRALLGADDFELAHDSPYDELLRAAVAAAEPEQRPEITPELPADRAIALVLLGFADAIAANVDGVLDDVDTEFLHDLRVAVRRTRSLLKLAGDVLPPRLVTRYAAGFKWLGDVTTPTRDMDVYLLELDELAGQLTMGQPDDLVPFGAHLRQQRERERRKLVRTLRSQRFARLLDGWTAALTEVLEEPEASEITARELAADRLHRILRRVIRLAKTISPDSPSERIHALRKRCKELRYLLEVIRPMCDAETHRTVIKELKRLQDVLGAFQDGEVQSEALRTFAEQMLERGKPPAATLLAMGELSAGFGAQQRQARAALPDKVQRFLGKKARQRIEGMLA